MSTRGKTGDALLWSLGVTVISAIGLTLLNGLPTPAQATQVLPSMFVVAFIFFRFIFPAFGGGRQ